MAKQVKRLCDGRSRRVLVSFLAGWLLGGVFSATPLNAQPAADEGRFADRARQLERAVYRHPRAGATFDLWYRHYAQVNRQAEWAARVEARRRESPQDANARLVWGLVCERQSNWTAAAEAYREAAQLSADDYYPHVRLADVLLRDGRPEEAAEALGSALRRNMPRGERLTIARQLGRLHLRLGNRPAAIELYLQLASEFGDDVRTLGDLAAQLQQLGELQSAAQLWQRVRQDARDAEARFEAQWQLAHLARGRGDRQAALDQYVALLDQVEPSSWRAAELTRALNQVLIEIDGGDGPVEFWMNRWRARPDDLAALGQASETLANAGRLEEAATLYTQAIERAPSRRDLRQSLIELLIRQGNVRQAIAQTRELLEQNPQDVDLWLALGRYQLQQGDQADADLQRQAAASWRRALRVRPNDADLALRVAELARTTAEHRSGVDNNAPATVVLPRDAIERNAVLWQAAEDFFREAVQRRPSAVSIKSLGELLHRRGQQQAAVETWLSLGRDGSAGGWRDASSVLQRFGHLDAARKAAQAAVDAEPHERDNWTSLLDVLVAQRDFSAATEAIERMQTQRPDDDAWQQGCWEMQATTMIAEGAIDKHLEVLHERLKDDPHDAQSLWIGAQLKEAAGDRPGALDLMRRLVELRPDAVDVRRRYATMLASHNQLAEAVEQYQDLIKRVGHLRGEDWQRLIRLQLRLGRTQDAAESVSQWLHQSPRDPEAYLLQAQVAAAEARPEQKLKALKQAVDVAPNDAQALRQYAQALVDEGRLDEALDVALRVLATTGQPSNSPQATLAWIVTWAEPELYGRVEQHLRRQRMGGAAAEDEWTRSLAFWLEQTGRPDEALRELQRVLTNAPADPLLLEQLVGLAELSRDTELAIQFQEQLVRLDPASPPREKLARLYRQAGRVDEAQAIWDQILERPMTARDATVLIDRSLDRGDFFAAQRLAEAGVNQFPTDWRLIYRAGLLHLAMEQPSAVREAFESLIRPRASDDAAESTFTRSTDALEWLRWALEADEKFGKFVAQRQGFGARHVHTLGQFSQRELLEPGGGTLAAAQVFAAVACLRALPDAVIDADRLVELAADSGETSAKRAVVAALWVTGHVDPAARMIDADSDLTSDELADWLRLLMVDAPWSENEAWLDRLEAGHKHFQNRYPADARTLLRLYGQRLLDAATDEQVVPRLERQVAAAPQVGWLVELGMFAPQLRSADREQFIARLWARADELIASADVNEPSAWPAADLRQWVEQLLAWDHVPDERRFGAIERWLPQAILVAQRQRPRQLPPPVTPATPLGALAQQMARSLAAHGRAGDDSASRRRLLQLLQADRTRTVLEDGTVVVSVREDGRTSAAAMPLTDGAESTVFPAANAWLDGASLRLLVQVAERYPAGPMRRQLIAAFDRMATSLEPSAAEARDLATTLRLAQVVLEWTWDEHDRALSRLGELAEADGQRPEFQQLLLRACLAAGRLEEAQQWLAKLPEEDAESETIRQLRTLLHQRWTDRLHWQDLVGHGSAVSDLAIHPSGNWLASVGIDGTVRQWDVASGELHRMVQSQGDILLCVAFSPDGAELAAGGYDRTIRRWRTTDGAELPALSGHRAPVRTLDYSPDGRHLIAGDDDHELVLWDLATGRAERRLEGHQGAILAARFTADGSHVISCSRDRTIRFWNTATGALERTVSTPGVTIRALVPRVEQGGEFALAGGDDRMLRIWPRPEPGDAPHKASEGPIIDTGAAIADFALSQDRTWVAIGGDDRLVHLGDLASRQPRITLAGHTGRVLAVALAPDGRWLASAGLDGTIKLWRLQ